MEVKIGKNLVPRSIMQESSSNRNLSKNKNISLLNQLKLVNVAEIEILKEVLWEIKTQYAEDKHILNLALVCALLLNHPDVPSLYATSPKGYGKLQAKYQQEYQQYIVEELLTWAIEQVGNLNQPSNLNQELRMINNPALKKFWTKSGYEIEDAKHITISNSDLFEILAALSLTNIVEQAVIYETSSYIQSDFASSCAFIDLSDVCALVLNYEHVPVMYATNAEEYRHYRQKYFTEYQTSVRNLIRRTVSLVNLEGSEHSFVQNTMAKSNANQRNISSWNNGNY